MLSAGSASSVELNEVIAELSRLLEAGKKDVALTAVRGVLESALAQNRALALQNAELLKKCYGRSSERINPRQLVMALEQMRSEQQSSQPTTDPDQEVANAPYVPDTPRRRSRKSKRRGRRALPADIEREEVRLVPAEAKLAGMSKVGETRSELLEFVPAKFKVVVYVRETWSDLTGQIVTAPVPTKLIPKGIPGPGLLTQVIVCKYRDCVPLTRQCRIYRRSGVDLARNTLVDWVAAAAHLLAPLAHRIYELAMLARVLQVDDTRLDTLDRSKAKNIKRAHLWALVGDKKYVSFRFTPDWTAERAEEFLGDRIGWMQVDGYGGYAPIAQDRPILLVGCWMHARRYFVKAFEARDVRAAEPLSIMKSMYKIEEASRQAGDDYEARLERRRRDLSPLLDDLGRWNKAMLDTVPPSEPLAKAITYLDNHWDILCVVEKDGALELDNGEVERVFRIPAMGRRNWLFAGSDAGGERAAILMTVLETAARADVDLRTYVQDVLTKIAGGWKNARLDELLPEQWAAAHPAPSDR